MLGGVGRKLQWGRAGYVVNQLYATNGALSVAAWTSSGQLQHFGSYCIDFSTIPDREEIPTSIRTQPGRNPRVETGSCCRHSTIVATMSSEVGPA